MDISIVGATGDVGRQVATTIVHERLLEKSDRLQLVGREATAPRLYGLADDLREAYDETAPQIDIAFYPEDIVADIVVMVAGVTVDPEAEKPMSRDDVAIANAPLLRSTARAIARHGHGAELIVIITNPVELGVEIFSEELGDRHRVVGMGAFIDSLRFRAELARDLFVRRHQVSGFCVGEHGSAILPLWSSIRVAGMDPEELDERLGRIRRAQPLRQFPERLAKNLKLCLGMIARKEYGPAYDFVESLTPEFRCVLRPHLTHRNEIAILHFGNGAGGLRVPANDRRGPRTGSCRTDDARRRVLRPAGALRGAAHHGTWHPPSGPDSALGGGGGPVAPGQPGNQRQDGRLETGRQRRAGLQVPLKMAPLR